MANTVLAQPQARFTTPQTAAGKQAAPPRTALLLGAGAALALLLLAAYLVFFRHAPNSREAAQPPAPPANPAAPPPAPTQAPAPPPLGNGPRLNVEQQLERVFTGLPPEDRATRLRVAEEFMRRLPNGPLVGRVRSYISALREQLRQDGITLVELLPRVDTGTDARHGAWTLDNGALRSDATGTLNPRPQSARLLLPYKPPAEYDFRIVFTRLEGSDAVVQVLTSGTRHFSWNLGSLNNRLYGFGLVNGNFEDPRASRRTEAVLTNTHRYDSIVYVRKNKVRGIVRELPEGGLPVLLYDVTYDTDYTDLILWEGWRMPEPSQLGLATYGSPTLFHEIGVTEIGAKGTFTRGE
jgi:hypothetical protein